jgi:hypothetical protein
MSVDSRLIRIVCAGLLLVTILCGTVRQVAAQEIESESAPRYLGGHLFIPSAVVPDPFISTSFGSTTGFGQAVGLKVPIRNLDGEKIGELEGDIAFMLLEFAYQQRIAKNFAVRAGALATARMGTSAEAILSEGISALYGYDLGASAKLLQKRNWRLTANVSLRGNTLYTMSPLAFARAVVEANQSGDSTGAVQTAQDSLLDTGTNSRVLGGLRGAYTPAEWIGFTGFVEGGLGERFQEGQDETSVINLGGTISFDLNPLTRTPIGLLASFRSESLSERGDDIGHSRSFGLGIFYTGRRFFSIGLDTTWSQVSQLQADTKVDVVQGRFVIRYDFE